MPNLYSPDYCSVTITITYCFSKSFQNPPKLLKKQKYLFYLSPKQLVKLFPLYPRKRRVTSLAWFLLLCFYCCLCSVSPSSQTLYLPPRY
ncbi:hypothetical protein FKM82_025055 [Ascaphus truei]